MNKAVFETTLSQIMRQNQDSAPRPRTRTGILDTHRLPFYKTTDKLFKKRAQIKKGKNYFISILMDASGSMHATHRITPCLKTVQKLCESLQHVVGVHFEIVGFNGIEMKFKDYNEPYDGKKVATLYYELCCTDETNRDHRNDDMKFVMIHNSITKEMIVVVPEEGNKYLSANPAAQLYMETLLPSENHDGIAVWNSFLRSKERDGRKILLVFSDGEPTFNWSIESLFKEKREVESYNGDKALARAMKESVRNGERTHRELADSFLKDVVKLSKRNNIDTVGIGIQSSEVMKYYQHWGVVHSTNDIYAETIRQLTKLFRKD